MASSIRDGRTIALILLWFIAGLIVSFIGPDKINGFGRVICNSVALLSGAIALASKPNEVRLTIPIVATLVFFMTSVVLLVLAFIVSDRALWFVKIITDIIDNVGYYPGGADSSITLSLLIWLGSLLLLALVTFAVALGLRLLLVHDGNSA